MKNFVNLISTSLLMLILHTWLIIDAYYLKSNEIWLTTTDEVTNTASSSVNYFIDKDLPQLEVLSSALSTENRGIFYLFTHTKPDQFRISCKWLDKEAIVQFINLEFLNIYDCNFAKGEKGLKALAHLDKQLGISVAAFTNVSGKDGDWNLEIGNQFFSAFAVPNHKYNLQATITSDKFNNENSSGGVGWVNNWTLTGKSSFTGGELFMNGGSPLDVARRPVNFSTVSLTQSSLSGRCEYSNSNLNTYNYEQNLQPKN
jgi:hypothetical protein